MGAWFLFGFLLLQRILELIYSAHNTRKLKHQGAQEFFPGHYPFMVAFHCLWLGVIAWLAVQDAQLQWPFFIAFIGLQLARLWVLFSLGVYWTTKIVRLPAGPVVRSGPYRFLKHPNYLVVVFEIAMVPLALGSWSWAVALSLLHLPILWIRVSCENRVLAQTH